MYAIRSFWLKYFIIFRKLISTQPLMENKEFRLEHYKTMREEYMNLILYIQRLWNYKLSTLGAVIAISILNEKLIEIEKINTGVDIDATLIISIGLLILPVLAFLIDLKIVEMGFQVKLISTHLKEKFADVAEITEWESKLWRNNSLATTRTWLSLVLYVGASMVILFLSFFTVGILQPTWTRVLWIVGSILAALPIIALVTLIPKIRA